MMLKSRRMLMDLAERKLGPGATIRITREGWIAEQVTDGKRTRVTGKSRDVLEWFLNQMPDLARAPA